MSDWMRVVVGVDGSAESQKALRWAYDEARTHGAELVAVGVRALPPPIVDPPSYGGFGWTMVVDGNAAPALIKAAEGADLLVVGSRGHGAFTGMLLGSVSLHVVTHAPGAVTVVR
jgi:nucleotide-binding universal stress UspA family protein